MRGLSSDEIYSAALGGKLTVAAGIVSALHENNRAKETDVKYKAHRSI
jgi:hypothetical protein